MIVFIDRVTGADHITDAYPHTVEHGGAIMKFPCKWGMFSDNEDIVLDGENPSAEADDCGGSDETRVRAINLVHMNGLMECDFMTKGAFKALLSLTFLILLIHLH
eukprot:sb/3478004/